MDFKLLGWSFINNLLYLSIIECELRNFIKIKSNEKKRFKSDCYTSIGNGYYV